MKYIITGATGHIGNTIVKKLIEQQKKVKVLVRKIDESIDNLPIEYAIGNIFKEDFLDKHINTEDIVIHLAGIIDAKNKLEKETYEINYLGTKTIMDVCLKKKIKNFLYFSSVDAIYKDGNGQIITEPTTFAIDKLKSYYGRSKALATEYVLSKQKEKVIPVTILYPSAVIGINDYKPSLIGKVVQDCLTNKRQFGIKGGYDFVDVEDIADFTIKIAEMNLYESFILSGHQISVFQMYKEFNKVIGRNRKVFHIPIWVAKLSIPFVSYLSKFTINTLLDRSQYDSSKAQKYGFYVRPFEETVKNTIAWHKNYLQKKSQLE